MTRDQIPRQPLQTLQTPPQPWRQSVENKKAAFVEITEQPGSRAVRFRYECEGRSTGTIPGASSTPENKTYPTIRVWGYQGEAMVVVSCVTKDKPYRPHPHSLVGREGSFEKGVCLRKIQSESMSITFATLGIQCVKKKDIKNSLKSREQARIDPFRTGFRHATDPKSNIDLNAVRLCFQVFIEGDTKGKFDFPLSPVVSDPIYDKKAMSDLVIVRLSHSEYPVDGGSGMILLCEKVANNDIQIRFYEEENGRIIWEYFGKVQPSDVHKQTAICFRPPVYYNWDITAPAKVKIQLHRPSDGASSEPWEFAYCPLNSGRTNPYRSSNSVVTEKVEQPRVKIVQEQTRHPPTSGQGYLATAAASATAGAAAAEASVSSNYHHRTKSSYCQRRSPSQKAGSVRPRMQMTTNAASSSYTQHTNITKAECAMFNQQHWNDLSRPSNAAVTRANLPNDQHRNIPIESSANTTALIMRFSPHALIVPVPRETDPTVNGSGPMASGPQMEDGQTSTVRMSDNFEPRPQMMACRFAPRQQMEDGIATSSSSSSSSSSEEVRNIAPRPQAQDCFPPTAQMMDREVPPAPQIEDEEAIIARILGDFAPRPHMMKVNVTSGPRVEDGLASSSQLVHENPPGSQIEDEEAIIARILGDFAPRPQMMNKDVAALSRVEGDSALTTQMMDGEVAFMSQFGGDSALAAHTVRDFASRPQTMDGLSPRSTALYQDYRNVIAQPSEVAAPNQEDNFQSWDTSDVTSATDVAPVQDNASHATACSASGEDRTSAENVPDESQPAESGSQEMEIEVWKLSGTFSTMSCEGDSEDERMNSGDLNNLVNSRLKEMFDARIAAIERDEEEERRKNATESEQ